MTSVSIQAAVSPSDPRVCAFTLDRSLSPASVVCRNADDARGSPLFEELFKLSGVVQAWADGSRVTVARAEETDWAVFAKDVGAALRRALADGRPPVAARETAPVDPADWAVAIRRVIDNEINPSLAAHGGRAELVEIQDRVARVRFSGGCQGCGAAQATLAYGLKRTLLDRVPGLRDVEDVTNHAAGEKPYYPADAGGSSPFLKQG